MPVVAANIIEAIALTTERVSLENRTNGEVFDQFVIFNAAIRATFNPDVANNRIVRSWLILAQRIEQELVASGSSIAILGASEKQRVVDVVGRTLYATFNARANAFITAAQNTAVLDGWNDSFGTLP